MVTVNFGLLLIGAFFIFEIGAYVGGEIEKTAKSNKNKEDKKDERLES